MNGNITLNNLLLFCAAWHAASLLRQYATGRPKNLTSWVAIPLGLLILAGLGFFLHIKSAGYIVGVYWFALILLPMYLFVSVNRAAVESRWQKAQTYATLLRLFYPDAGWKYAVAMYKALSYIDQGKFGEGLEVVKSQPEEAVQGWFSFQRYTLMSEWSAVLERINLTVPDANADLTTKTSITTLRLRALGELGRVDEMIDAFADDLQAIQAMEVTYRRRLFVMILAFTGNPLLIEQSRDILTKLYPPYAFDMWLGTAYLVSGDATRATALFDLAASQGDSLLHEQIQKRLTVFAHPQPLSPASSIALKSILEVWRREIEAP